MTQDLIPTATTDEQHEEANRQRMAKLAERVKALFAKALSTDSEEEREALTRRAEKLIADHQIDMALLVSKGEATDGFVEERLDFPAPYAPEFMGIAVVIAWALGCRTAVGGGHQMSFLWVFGYASDVERVKMLAASIVSQAQRELASTPVPARSKPAPFRRSFLKGYAANVHARLCAIHKRAKDEAEEATPGTALVLADRASLLRAAWDAHSADMPEAKDTTKANDAAGARAGIRAADRADLGQARLTS